MVKAKHRIEHNGVAYEEGAILPESMGKDVLKMLVDDGAAETVAEVAPAGPKASAKSVPAPRVLSRAAQKRAEKTAKKAGKK